jgi:PAS domain S-box-containing protein
MGEKHHHNKLEQRIRELENEIAQRDRTEEMLRGSEEKYRHIVDNVNVGILVVQDFSIVFSNAAISTFLGYSRDELVNNPNPFEFIYADDRETVFERHVKRLKGEDAPDTYSFRVVTKDGIIIWVEVTGIRIDWEGKPATLNFFRDITVRVQSEEKLRETIDYLENVFDNSAEAIGIVDQEGRFIKWNKMSAELYGYAFSEMKEKSFFDLYADKYELEKMINWLRKDGFVRDYEINMKRKDGGIFPANISISRLKDKFGTNIGSVCVARNLTEKKQAEKERLHYEKLQGVIEIAGAICHEVNQPLMAIFGLSELISMDVPEENPARKKIAKILDQAEKIGQITRKLMNITKYETKDYLNGKIIDIDKAAE